MYYWVYRLAEAEATHAEEVNKLSRQWNLAELKTIALHNQPDLAQQSAASTENNLQVIQMPVDWVVNLKPIKNLNPKL